MKPNLPSRPSKDPDKLSASWICKLLDCIEYAMSHPKGDGSTILNQLGGTLRAVQQKGSPQTGGSSSYTGPYAVIKKDDTNVTVILEADDETYWQTSKVISGLTETAAGSDTDVAISASGYVYASIAYSGGYVVSFECAASVPSQTASNFYVPIARVIVTNSKISKIVQIQEGQIYPTAWGRIGG